MSAPTGGSSSEQSDVAALETVLFRFATTDDNKFAPAVVRVLPRVLQKLDSPSKQVHAKVLEVFRHINARMKDVPELQLPVSALLDVYIGAKSTLTKTFALVYVAKGLPQMPLEKRPQALQRLVAGVSQLKSKPLRSQVSHIFASSLSGFNWRDSSGAAAAAMYFFALPPTVKQMDVKTGGTGGVDEKSEEKTAESVVQTEPADREVVISHLLDLMLYSDNFMGKSKGLPCPGMSPEGYKQMSELIASIPVAEPAQLSGSLVRNATRSKAGAPPALGLLKRGILGLALSAILQPTEALPILLSASASGGGGDANLRSDAESYLRRMGGSSASGPGSFFSLDDPTKNGPDILLKMFLGDPPDKGNKLFRRRGAHLELRGVIVNYLARSKLAAKRVKESIRVVFECLFSPSSNQRLRMPGINYLRWCLEHLTPSQLSRAAPVYFKGILKLIQMHKASKASKNKAKKNVERPDGKKSPKPKLYPISPLVVGSAYSVLGEIVAKLPKLGVGSSGVFMVFLQALSSEMDSEEISGRVYEGLMYVAKAYKSKGSKTALSSIKKTLVSMALNGGNLGRVKEKASLHPSQRQRLAVVESANRLFPFEDCQARLICLAMSNDPSLKVRKACQAGLKPLSSNFTGPESKPEARPVAKSESKVSESKASEAKKVSESKEPEPKKQKTSDSKGDENTSGDGKDTPPTDSKHTPPTGFVSLYPPFEGMVSLLFQTLQSNGLGYPTLRESLRFIHLCFSFNAKAKGVLPREFAKALLHSSDSIANTSLLSFQKLVEMAFKSSDPSVIERASRTLVALVRWAPEQFAETYSKRDQWLKENLINGSKVTRESMGHLLEAIAGHMTDLQVGSLLEQLLDETILPNAKVDALRDLSTNTNALCGALLGAGILAAEACVRVGSGPGDTGLIVHTERLTRACATVLSHHAPNVVAMACKVIQRLSVIRPLPLPSGLSDGDSLEAKGGGEPGGGKRLVITPQTATKAKVISRLLYLTTAGGGKDSKSESSRGEGRVPEEAVRALGKFAKGSTGPEASVWRKKVVQGLFRLKSSGHEELHFAVGAALVDCSGGSDVGLGDIIDQVLTNHINQGSAVQRAASCTWLLCLTKYGGGKPILDRAHKIQKAFSIALTESRQLTQECASKGLAVLYDIGDEKTKADLVDDLARVFKAGTRKVMGDTQIEVGVSSGSRGVSSGKMATYRELCTMANDIGQPELVYKFLDLAAHHSVWNSKSGAAFSLGSILKASEKLRPSLEGLIPKLFRYKHDPDPKIRASMQDLWNNLMTDHKTGRRHGLEARHFKPILKELLASMAKSEWRVRQSAALAMASLTQGIKAGQIADHLQDIWQAVFRLLDDRKESVRKEGSTLARTLTSLVERLCNPVYTRLSSAKMVLNIMLPLLAGEDGITHKVKEIQAVCVSALLRVVKAAKRLVAPHLPLLVTSLLTAMSTLEPQAFSYMQFHAASVDLTEEQLERLRVLQVSNSPLQTALDTCLEAAASDARTVPQVASAIAGLVRQGLGLPTLTGCARFASRLVVQARLAGGGPEITSRLEEASSEMLRAFTRGLGDQSATVRKEYARTIGHLCAVGKPKEVRRVVQAIVRMYTNAELHKSGDEDYKFVFPDKFTESSQRKRYAAGETAKYMVLKASQNVGRFYKELLAVAFVATHDDDQQCKDAWKECWSECVLSTADGVGVYLEEIVGLCLAMFSSPSYFLKKITINSLEHAIRVGHTSARMRTHIPQIKDLLLRAVESSHYWNGKECLFSLASCLATNCNRELPLPYQKALLNAIHKQISRAATAPPSSRLGRPYLLAGLRCLESMGKALTSIDCFVSAKNAITLVLKDSLQEPLGRSPQGGSEVATDTKINPLPDKTVKKSNKNAVGVGVRVGVGVGVGVRVDSKADSKPIDRAALKSEEKKGGLLIATALKALGESWPKTRSLPNSYVSMRSEGSWIITLALNMQRGQSWSIRSAALSMLTSVMSTVYLGSSPRPSALEAGDAEKAVSAAMRGLDDSKYAAVRKEALKCVIAMGKRGSSLGALVSGSTWEQVVTRVTVLLKERDDEILRLAEKALESLDAALEAASAVPMETEEPGMKKGGDMYL